MLGEGYGVVTSVIVIVLGLLFVIAGFLLGIQILFYAGSLLFLSGLVAVVVVAIARSREPTLEPASRPLGYTERGEPIYPVVGYTAGGSAITADKAIGYRPYNPQTNGLAVATLILAFVFPLLAIPLGHISRGQIRRTGEQGGGVALAGLLISYIWIGLVVVALLVVFLGLSAH